MAVRGRSLQLRPQQRARQGARSKRDHTANPHTTAKAWSCANSRARQRPSTRTRQQPVIRLQHTKDPAELIRCEASRQPQQVLYRIHRRRSERSESQRRLIIRSARISHDSRAALRDLHRPTANRSLHTGATQSLRGRKGRREVRDLRRECEWELY